MSAPLVGQNGSRETGGVETVDAIDLIPQQPQRQDSLNGQMRDLRRAANRLGLYDAADWIRSFGA